MAKAAGRKNPKLTKIDGIWRQVEFRKMILENLAFLKSKLYSLEILAQKNFLGKTRRMAFAFGLILPKTWQKQAALFLVGSLLLLLLVGSLSRVDRDLRLRKQILGVATTAALEELKNISFDWDEVANSSNQELYHKLRSSRSYLVAAREKLPNVGKVLGPLKEAREVLQEAIKLQTFLLKLLGGEPKDYLLIFQNNNEMRPTGGFIGTYGLLEFRNGQMNLKKIESIYALDGQLEEAIPAPGPLQRQVSKKWAMRDSNWFVDFPTSARKILEFLEKEGGILADGVIALTPDVFENLLLYTGPIAMPEYGVTLTPENFRAASQQKTSYEYDRELNQPKKFLADFAPRFLSQLQNLDFEIMLKLIAQKQILMFSLDPEFQEVIRDNRLDGGIQETDGDYLAIYHSNVGGGKTDQNILQKVEKKVSVLSGGLAIVRLKITRTHHGFEEKYFPKNLDFMRILVPAQAKLLQASGFDDFAVLPSALPGAQTDPDLKAWDQALSRDEIHKMYVGREAGYTVFSNWLELLPGQIKTLELTYEVKLPRSRAYTHLLQKQPGSRPFEFSLEVKYLPGKIVYTYPQKFTSLVDSDRFYAVLGE